MHQILRDLDLTRPSNTPDVGCMADQRGHAVRLSVTGELDLATTDSLTHVAISALQLPVRVLILDIYGITFCDAAGVNALIRIQQAASKTGSYLVLTGIQPRVKYVLDLVGLTAREGERRSAPVTFTRGHSLSPAA